MKTWMPISIALALALVAAPGCTANGTGDDEGSDVAELTDPGDPGGEDAENELTGQAEQALCQWNYIRHYDYTDGTGTYNWDVSLNLSTGKQYVGERRVGGGFYKQYVLTPSWTTCSFSGTETVSLKNGGTTLTGPHNCLSGTDEEVHLEKQRLLHRKPLFIEYLCL